ncbi:MAG: Rpp14/Pop5 family protein [Candidatus Altiarchaeota archaeon]
MPKLLKPTLRERNRYLVFEAMSDNALERKDVVDAVWSSLLRLYGEVGAAKTSLWVMDWDAKKKMGILKVNHKSVDTMRSAATMVKEINGKRTSVNILRVTGTLRKARQNL